MKIVAYAISEFAPKLVAAHPRRQWMDDFPDRHAYRCLPLAIANAHGWEALCPVPIEIEWNGGPSADDIVVRALKPLPGGQPADHFCRSHFTHGIVTFHLDYIFQTEKGCGLLATGPFNRPKDNAAPLTGIMETDWLPYPFTMNWQILRPGRVAFEEGEPYCFVFPLQSQLIVDTDIELRRLEENPELSRQHQEYRVSREKFKEKYAAGDPDALKQPWIKHYFLGQRADGTKVDDHVNKLRLREPVDLRPLLDPANEQAVERPGEAASSAPLWDTKSVLNYIVDRQTEANRIGRARISPEGLLDVGDGVQIIESERDAVGCDFLVREGLLSESECEAVRNAFFGLEGELFKSDKIDPYWNNRFVWHNQIAAAFPEAGAIMLAAHKRAIKLVSGFYRLKAPIYADLLQIVRWESGMFMPPHADNANPDGSAHVAPHRNFAGVVYLNDDYEGGELYFTDLNVAVRPRRGMLVSMTGGFRHEHGVLLVKKGKRLTMPFFLTFDASKAERSLL